MRRTVRSSLTACLLALVGVQSISASAATGEAAVKAAFLPKFARYVTWPPTARPVSGTALQLCVIGRDPFGSELDEAVRSQNAQGQRVIVRRLNSASGAASCHVAFVSGASEPTGQILLALGRRPILTITDARSSSQRGIIHFTVVGGRVRFFIDNLAASQRELSISSRLLGLAVAVRS
jgi:hypothetical protein